MHLSVIGINHHIAPIEIRERVHFSETQIIDATDQLLDSGILELVILSTCNRSELYLVTKNKPISQDKALSIFEDFFEIDTLGDYLFCKHDVEAIDHLVRVSCGLDSLIIGEDQILGQVREAHQTALELGSAKKVLNKIFREAITLAKRIKTETDVSDQPLSISYIGVKKVAQNVKLKNTRVLVIGMGKMGRLAMEHLLEEEAHILISNRTKTNSVLVKEKYPQVEIIDYADLSSAIAKSEVIVSATSSPHTILSKDDFTPSSGKKYVMDLSLPRDVHPNVADLENIQLYDIDSLESIAQDNLQYKKKILQAYEPEFASLSQELFLWMDQAQVDPIMKNLNERCDEIAQDTLDYIFRKTQMSHSQKRKVDKIVRSALKKVAREPVLYIKNGPIPEKDRETAIQVLNEVYRP